MGPDDQIPTATPAPPPEPIREEKKPTPVRETPKPMGIGSWLSLLVLFLVLGGVLAGVGLSEWRLLSQLRQLRTQQSDIEQRSSMSQVESRSMQRRLEKVDQGYQQVVADRDNLLEQVNRLSRERDVAETQRRQIEDALAHVASQRLELQGRLTPLEQEYGEVLQDREELLKDRDQLQQSLEALRKSSDQKTLKMALAREESERKQLTQSLKEAEQRSKRLTKEQAKVEKNLVVLQSQFEPLREHYAKLLSEHRTLKKKSERAPEDVTNLAREHERLVKDLADTHYNMGVMFSKRRDYVRASTEFEKVVELKPDDTESYFNLGVIYSEHLPDRERAFRFFQRFLAMNPKGREAAFAKQYIATWHAWEAKERLE